jgi:hypothetical protein
MFFRDPTGKWSLNFARSEKEKEPNHFVGEDTVESVMMQRYHPIEPLDLIRPHLSTMNVCAGNVCQLTMRGCVNDNGAQFGDSSKTKGWSSSSSAFSPSLSNSSSSSFSLLRCRLSLTAVAFLFFPFPFDCCSRTWVSTIAAYSGSRAFCIRVARKDLSERH